MNIRIILSYFLVCLGTATLKNVQAYPIAVSSWNLPDGTPVLNVGEAHLVTDSLDADAEYLCIFTNIVKQCNEAQIPLLIISEGNEARLKWTKQTGATYQGTILNNINFLCDDSTNKTAKSRTVQLKRADLRSVGYHDLMNYCFDLQELYNTHGEDQKQLKQLCQQWRTAHTTAQSTKKMLLEEVKNVAVLLENGQKKTDAPFLTALIAETQELYTNMDIFFAKCSANTRVCDFIYQYCVDKGILSCLKAVAPLVESCGACMADAGFIRELSDSIEKKQPVMVYTGDAHRKKIDQFLKSINAQCVSTSSNNSQKNFKNLDVRTLEHCVNQFTIQCLEQTEKRKKDAAVPKPSEKTVRTINRDRLIHLICVDEQLDIPESTVILLPALEKQLRDLQPGDDPVLMTTLLSVDMHALLQLIDHATIQCGYEQVQNDLHEQKPSKEKIDQWKILLGSSDNDLTGATQVLGSVVLDTIVKEYKKPVETASTENDEILAKLLHEELNGRPKN